MALSKPHELKPRLTTIGMIYGAPGTAKTTMALTFPNPGIIDFDNGLDRALFQCDFLQPKKFQEVRDAIKNDFADYDTIVIDTAGKCIDMIINEIREESPQLCQRDGSLQMKGWGVLKHKFAEFVKLCREQNKNLVFVAHETEEKQGDIIIKRPDMAGSARKDVIKELDWMGYATTIGSDKAITFRPTESIYAKNALGLNDYIKLPPISEMQEFMTRTICNKIVEIQEKRLQDRELYNSLIEKELLDIAELSTADEFNYQLKHLSEIKHIFDSKQYLWGKLKDAATSKGLLFDAKNKEFINAK